MTNSEWRMSKIRHGGANRESNDSVLVRHALASLAVVFHSPFAIRHSLFLLFLAASLAPLAVNAQTAEPQPSPDQEEQEDLSERLIRQATGEQDAGLMGRIMNLMSEAAGQLKRDFDPGQDTQQIQGEIIEKLDEAIAVAQRRRSRVSGQQQQVSDKRRGQRRTDGQKPGQQPADGDKPPDREASTTGQDQGAKSTATGRLREFRRGWGNLPQRDRDEVLQGIDEDVLEKYRPLIEDYFRALSEDEEE